MSSKSLTLSGISKRFGNVAALDNFNLEVGVGELVALLGPSGCGKTTALRVVAGLEHQDKGTVLVADKNISDVPAHKRNMGMVFQAYSLFPNLTVEENVAFGLQMRKVSKPVRLKKAHTLLDLVGLDSQSKRFTHQLSGGQQQRVALARALAFEPEILLLDEPLSALDAQVRVNLREEIRRLQLSLGTTTLFVTHDQEEAMAISDRVGVMNEGVLEQIDTPDALYNKPASSFVASFVGTMNRIPAQIADGMVEIFGSKVVALTRGNESGKVIALIRPESISVVANSAAPNAKVLTRSFMGASSNIICQMADRTIVQSLMTSASTGDLHPGTAVQLRILSSEVLVANV
jgi:putative spermidine/putrescine transport system ATP-binding protein